EVGGHLRDVEHAERTDLVAQLTIVNLAAAAPLSQDDHPRHVEEAGTAVQRPRAIDEARDVAAAVVAEEDAVGAAVAVERQRPVGLGKVDADAGKRTVFEFFQIRAKAVGGTGIHWWTPCKVYERSWGQACLLPAAAHHHHKPEVRPPLRRHATGEQTSPPE